MRSQAPADRHLLARYREDEVKEQVDRIVPEAERNVISQGTAGGHERRLRGLPVIGPAAGAIPGTIPHLAVERELG